MSTTLTAATVTPAPENAAVIPDWKPVPVRFTVCDEAPCPIDDGVTVLTSGLAAMSMMAVAVDVPPSLLVKVKLRLPAVALAATDSSTVSRVAELNVTVPTVTPLPVCLLLLDYWPLGRLRLGRTANQEQTRDRRPAGTPAATSKRA